MEMHAIGKEHKLNSTIQKRRFKFTNALKAIDIIYKHTNLVNNLPILNCHDILLSSLNKEKNYEKKYWDFCFIVACVDDVVCIM